MKNIKELIDFLYKKVPAGVGSTGKIKVKLQEEKKIMVEGAKWAGNKGYGCEGDLEYCEENGAIKEANPAMVSERVFQRGKDQSGTLGSGNHFLELQVVDEIYQDDIAKGFNIKNIPLLFDFVIRPNMTYKSHVITINMTR